MYCFGVDIGGTTIKMGLFQEDGTVLDKWEIESRTENGGAAVLPDIAKAIEERLKKFKIEKHEVAGIGVGVPAPVTKEGIVERTANIGWTHKNVKQELEALTGMKSEIGNDANVAALGEMWKGGGAGNRNMVMITLGTGVGGGIIIDGSILIGKSGAGGEVGHLCVNEEETKCCGCGKKGCLEQYASATGIARLAKEKLGTFTGESLLKGNENPSAKDVFDAVKEGDELAKEVAKEFGNYLGVALANVAVLVDPSIFVIGGGVSRAGEVLLDYIREPFREHAFFANRDVQFALAKLANDAGIYGAAKLVLES